MARISVGTKPTSTVSDVKIAMEQGVTNVLGSTSFDNWFGSTIYTDGAVTLGRDPTAPTQDELVGMLRKDGQAKALYRLITLPLRTAFASGKWIKPTTGGGSRETDFANKMWSLPSSAGGMSVPVQLIMQQIMLAIPYGFSAFEVVRKVPKVGDLKGKIVIDKLSYRDSRTITFLVDKHGNYQGMRQKANFAGVNYDVILDPVDTFFYTNNHAENPFYGVSDFEPAFKHYKIKWKMYYIGDLAAQFAAVPGRLGYVPVGAPASQIRSFRRDIENFAFNNSMLVPPNFKVDNFNGNSNFDFLKLIDHQNTQMAKSFLAQFLQEENAHVIIQSGSTDASADMFIQFLEAISNEIAELISTKLMAPFIDYNFGTGKYPRFRPGPLTDTDKDLLQQVFTDIVSATTLNVTPEFARQTEIAISNRLDYDIDWDEIAAAEAEQVKIQQEMAAKGLNPDGSPMVPPDANANPNAPGQTTANPNSNAQGFTNQYSRAGSPQPNKVGLSDAFIALSQIITDVPDEVLPALQEAVDGPEVIPEAEEI